MSKQDRATLKSYFRKGALPTAEQYRDLIDSAVNQVEDGFDKSKDEGLSLSSTGGSNRLMSWFEGAGSDEPSWVLEHDENVRGALHFKPGRPGPLSLEHSLTLNPMGYIGVGTPDPVRELDVAGTVKSRSRTGSTTQNIPYVAADGKWHTISKSLTGCQILEVIAGTGNPRGRGRYSLMHAIAMNAFNPSNPIMNWLFGRKRIKTQTAVFGSYADRIRLRWISDKDKPHHYKLQIRTNARFDKDRVISYSITSLWLDPFMETAQSAKAAE